MKKSILLVLILTFSSALFARPVKRIKFPRGATKVAVSGYLNGYQDSQIYLIRLRKGQKMTVDANRSVSLYITGPDGEPASEMDLSCHTHQIVENSVAGDYKIRAVQCQKADPWKGTFKLSIKAERMLPPLPSDEELSQLVQTTTQDFAEAIETEDFTNFREATSISFKQTYTVKKFNESFQAFINQKERVVLILRSAKELKPEYSSVPKISFRKNYDSLKADGSYATKPLKTNFEYEYIRESDKWKLIAIRIRMQTN